MKIISPPQQPATRRHDDWRYRLNGDAAAGPPSSQPETLAAAGGKLTGQPRKPFRQKSGEVT
jgi:hypothetical protein